MSAQQQQPQEQPWSYDVSRQYIGSVYARALLRVTEKRASSEAVLEEFADFVQLLERLPTWRAVLTSPRVPVEHKLQMLDKALGRTMDRDLLCFLKVVARRGRMDCVNEMLVSARQQLDQLRGRKQVVVESAVPLDAELQQEVAQQLQQFLGCQVRLDCRLRPELVGGLVVRVGDTVYDASVLNQLGRWQQAVAARIRQELRRQVARFTQ
ncbi:MAG: ATP synthase subunit delta [Pirellulaceae bacterium]|nr:MAG: ATP synthase subunit delta [Pirellulaceae bacterium]